MPVNYHKKRRNRLFHYRRETGLTLDDVQIYSDMQAAKLVEWEALGYQYKRNERYKGDDFMETGYYYTVSRQTWWKAENDRPIWRIKAYIIWTILNEIREEKGLPKVTEEELHIAISTSEYQHRLDKPTKKRNPKGERDGYKHLWHS